MQLFPDYRRTDGHRTAIGDALVRRLPVAFRTSRGWGVGLSGSWMGAAYVRKVIARPTPWGWRLGAVMVQTKPWGMSKVMLRAFGLVVGRG